MGSADSGPGWRVFNSITGEYETWQPGREVIDTRKLEDIETTITPGPGYHWEEVSPGVFELCADAPTIEGPSLTSIVEAWEGDELERGRHGS